MNVGMTTSISFTSLRRPFDRSLGVVDAPWTKDIGKSLQKRGRDGDPVHVADLEAVIDRVVVQDAPMLLAWIVVREEEDVLECLTVHLLLRHCEFEHWVGHRNRL